MANSYTQLIVHIVIAVKNRESLLLPPFDIMVHKYISGIISGLGNKSLIVNGAKDHIHILLGQKPSLSVSEIVREVKKSSSSYIKDEGFIKGGKFYWQEGYAAFTVSKREMKKVYVYINDQKRHHNESSFMKEYLALLGDHEIEYNREYIFTDPDE